MQLLILPIILCFSMQLVFCDSGDDLYKLLDVARDANLKEIRKAFKLLAVKLHPDKNKDDDGAEAKFVRIARAYEILKDPETRKHYDLHGDTQTSDKKQQYHSYTYYRDRFGIYDDDPLIITLSRADYDVNVLDDTKAWFVNFYSPNCHHCHEMAPVWRNLASSLDGVVKFAAVNCEDDWNLCYQLNIQSYPTLLYYEKEANVYEGVKYNRARTFDKLKQFILDRANVKIADVTSDSWENVCQKQCLLLVCTADVNCLDAETRVKLAAILDGLLPVALVTDPVLAEQLPGDVVLVQKSNTSDWSKEALQGTDAHELVDEVLRKLPNPRTLSEREFGEIRSKGDDAWLICFYMGLDTDLDLQLKRLPGLLSGIRVGLVHCGKSSALCTALHINRYPSWGVLKPQGGAFEQHRGRDVIHDLVAFARDSVKSTNFHALTPADYQNILESQDEIWLVDWYAPWCPPCKRLLPELRRASQRFAANQLKFGTIDCTQFRDLCSGAGIASYPTLVVYNSSALTHYHGVLNEAGIVEFLQDYLSPRVVSLNAGNFHLLSEKSEDELWFVDWYAPWCGPCQRLSVQWRRLANQMVDFKQVKLAQVDCVAQSSLCEENNIQAYPTLRLYPLESHGLSTVAIYNGNRDATSLKRWILNFIPSTVLKLDAEQFREILVDKVVTKPYLVDFYASWCEHCVHFEPEFRKIAEQLQDRVVGAKVDCEVERHLCASLYINSYPTVVLFLDNDEKYEIPSGNAEEIVRVVENHLERQERRHDEL